MGSNYESYSDFGNSSFDESALSATEYQQASTSSREFEKLKALTVSAALNLVKGALESVTVTILGEVSEVSNKAGYKAVYFTVKDNDASLPCMMWLNRYRSAGVDLRVGMLVQITGRFSLYAKKGRMNFDVFNVTLAGEGDLRMKVAALARKLQAEGLTDSSRKRPLPELPVTIGLVTSPRGAAVHDVLRTLRRRNPLARVLLAGVPVEGDKAPERLMSGIQTVAEAGAEVILLVRGGGSFEDLMPFNDEALARAVASCPVPIVTGIGHEPDTSIVDMVADMRASTPTAAAEAVSPGMESLHAHLARQATRMNNAFNHRLDMSRTMMQRYADKPYMRDPHALLFAWELELEDQRRRLVAALPLACNAARQDLSLAAARLHDLSPLTILSRGYAITRDKEGKIVKSVNQVRPKEKINVTVSDGVIRACVENV